MASSTHCEPPAPQGAPVGQTALPFFDDFGTKLPAITDMLIATSDFISNYFYLIPAIPINPLMQHIARPNIPRPNGFFPMNPANDVPPSAKKATMAGPMPRPRPVSAALAAVGRPSRSTVLKADN